MDGGNGVLNTYPQVKKYRSSPEEKSPGAIDRSKLVQAAGKTPLTSRKN